MTPKVLSLAFVSDAIYPYNKGGKESRLFEISSRLAIKGFDVHIYCMKWWDGQSTKKEHGVTLHGICPYIPLYSGTRRSIAEGIIFGISCFKLLFFDFDIVDVDHMPFFPIFSIRVVCWLKRKPMFASWHEVWGKKYWVEYLGGVKGLIASWIEQTSVQLPDEILAVSKMTADRLKYDLKRTKKVKIIPNGVDLEQISKVVPSAIFSDVLYAGRMLSHKNIDVLLQAIAILKKNKPQVQLILIGDGPEKNNLEKLVVELKLQKNVRFLPFLESPLELYGIMKSTKVFVLPSIREGFGMSVLEANACQTPVVTVNHPDNAAKTVLSYGSVVALKPESIATAVEKFISTKKMQKKVSHVYSWSSIIDEFSLTYSEAVKAS